MDIETGQNNDKLHINKEITSNYTTIFDVWKDETRPDIS